jgi:hypothetical protein
MLNVRSLIHAVRLRRGKPNKKCVSLVVTTVGMVEYVYKEDASSCTQIKLASKTLGRSVQRHEYVGMSFMFLALGLILNQWIIKYIRE